MIPVVWDNAEDIHKFHAKEVFYYIKSINIQRKNPESKEVKLGKKNLIITAALLLILIIAGCAAPAAPTPATPTPQKPAPTPPKVTPIEWKCQSNFPTTGGAVTHMLGIVKTIETRSEGRLKIKVFEPGQLVKTPETLPALSSGMIDAAMGVAAYWAGAEPQLAAIRVPFSYPNIYSTIEAYLTFGVKDTVAKILQKHNTHYLGAAGTGAGCIMTTKPIRKFSDFKGLKMRADPARVEVWKSLGAVPVTLAAAEQYTGLQRGTVDGIEYPIYAMQTYKFAEVVDYATIPPVYQGMAGMTVNMDKWNALPDDIKKIVEETFYTDYVTTYTFKTATQTLAAIEYAKSKGVEFYAMPPEEVAKMRESVAWMWDDLASKGPLAAELIDKIKQEIAYWEMANKG